MAKSFEELAVARPFTRLVAILLTEAVRITKGDPVLENSLNNKEVEIRASGKFGLTGRQAVKMILERFGTNRGTGTSCRISDLPKTKLADEESFDAIGEWVERWNKVVAMLEPPWNDSSEQSTLAKEDAFYDQVKASKLLGRVLERYESAARWGNRPHVPAPLRRDFEKGTTTSRRA